MIIDDYTLIEKIGEGSFGEVYKSYKKDSNLTYATKRIDKNLVESKDYMKYFLNEITILKEIYHKNIVKLECLKRSSRHYYIMMEYYNGGTLRENFEKYISKYGRPFSEKIIQHIMRQLVEAISYLHEKKIVHRDLKLDNILLNFSSKKAKEDIDILNSELKLIDFGSATFIKNASLLKTIIGSPLTMDPRILKKYNLESPNNIPYDEKIDIWSLGILSYYLFTGEKPFKSNNPQDLMNEIEIGEIKIPMNISKEGISFLLNMLQYNPSQRITASELKQHPFLQGYIGNFEYIDIKKYINLAKNGNLLINIKQTDPYSSIINIINESNIKQNSSNNNSNLETMGNTGGYTNFSESAPFIGVKMDNNFQIPYQSCSKTVCEPIINNLINQSSKFNDQFFQNSLLMIKNNNNNELPNNNLINSSPISSLQNVQKLSDFQPLNKMSMNERFSIYKSLMGPESLEFNNISIQSLSKKNLNNIHFSSNSNNSKINQNKIILNATDNIQKQSIGYNNQKNIINNNIKSGNSTNNPTAKFNNIQSQLNMERSVPNYQNQNNRFLNQNMMTNNNIYYSYQINNK